MSSVCHHSGVCCQLCEYKCPSCEHNYIACPDTEEIRVACQAIRDGWPECRFKEDEMYEELNVTRAHRINDGMRRNDKGTND
jgi:hypothetical protein